MLTKLEVKITLQLLKKIWCFWDDKRRKIYYQISHSAKKVSGNTVAESKYTNLQREKSRKSLFQWYRTCGTESRQDPSTVAAFPTALIERKMTCWWILNKKQNSDFSDTEKGSDVEEAYETWLLNRLCKLIFNISKSAIPEYRNNITSTNLKCFCNIKNLPNFIISVFTNYLLNVLYIIFILCLVYLEQR